MSRARSPADVRSAPGGGRGRSRGLGSVLSDVLHKRSRISRSAPRLRGSGEPGADPRLKKSTDRVTDQNGFQQWLQTCRAVVWLPTGIPKTWRQRIWVTLADHYLQSIAIDWEKSKHLFLSELQSLDEDALGSRVEKDLLQSSLKLSGGLDVESFLAALKRLLLAYAHWNKRTGYCQGFIIPAAVILMVMGRDEGDAFKVLVYLLDRVLPDSYFANSVSALTVDVAVFHELLKIQLPELLQHLEHLYRAAKPAGDGRCLLPLHSLVTMHWFLTLFTTCLPKESILRIFDAIFFEGSEVLLHVALVIWAQLGQWIKGCQSIDEVSHWLDPERMEGKLMDSVELMQAVYSMATVPFPKVKELREKYSLTALQAKLPTSSCQGGESTARRSTSSETNDHYTFLAAVGYSEAQNPQNQHKTAAQGENQRRDCDVVWTTAGDKVPQREATLSSREQMAGPVVKPQHLEVPKHQQQLSPKHGVAVPALPLRSSKTKGINRFLVGQKLKNSSRSDQVHHTAGPRTTQPGQKEQKNKLTVPWCSQKKVSRKGLGRNSKAKSGCSDTVSLLEDQTDSGKAEFSKGDDSIHEESRKTPGKCWERKGEYGEQLTGSSPDADSLAGLENLLEALQIVEHHQYLMTAGPTQKLNPSEISTEKDLTAFSDMKENPTKTSLPGYLSSKSLGKKNSGIRGSCGNVQLSQHRQ